MKNTTHTKQLALFSSFLSPFSLFFLCSQGRSYPGALSVGRRVAASTVLRHLQQGFPFPPPRCLTQTLPTSNKPVKSSLAPGGVSQPWNEWHFSLGHAFDAGACLVHWRMFSIIPGLHLLDVSSNPLNRPPPPITMSPDTVKYPLGAISGLVEKHCLRESRGERQALVKSSVDDPSHWNSNPCRTWDGLKPWFRGSSYGSSFLRVEGEVTSFAFLTSRFHCLLMAAQEP